MLRSPLLEISHVFTADVIRLVQKMVGVIQKHRLLLLRNNQQNDKFSNPSLFTRMLCATNNSHINTRKFGGWERESFTAQTRSFLCGKFSTAWLEVLPNLRYAGVFQMSMLVNLGIGFHSSWAFDSFRC